jgi:hypothetical protein
MANCGVLKYLAMGAQDFVLESVSRKFISQHIQSMCIMRPFPTRIFEVGKLCQLAEKWFIRIMSTSAYEDGRGEA